MKCFARRKLDRNPWEEGMHSMTDLGSLILNIMAVVCTIQLTPWRSTRNRLDYVRGLSLVLLCLLSLILMIMIDSSGARGSLPIKSFAALSYCLIAALSVFSVQRTNDLRWSRWLNLVIVLPFVSLGWCLVLCVARKNPGSGSPAFHKYSAARVGTGRQSARVKCDVQGTIETNALR
jgi:hypothetical protein